MDDGADERAVSPLIGAILLAGFLVAALTLYQVDVVPRENQEVEFEHYLTVVGDMQELRNAIVSVAETNALEAASVALGTRYPRRTVGVNPPPPRGTLETRTTGSGIVTVSGVNMTALCGLERPVTTAALVYEPEYAYLSRAEPIVYGGTVLFREAEGGVVFESDQAIVQGRTISLSPIVGSVSASSARRETFDFRGRVSGETTVSRALTVTVPTRLSAATWEDELLAGEEHVRGVTQNGSNAVDIELEAATYTLRCTAIGADETPDVDPTSVDADRGINPRDINPAVPGGVRLENERRTGGDSVAVELNNTGAIDVDIEEARINFYHDGNGNENTDPERADVVGPSGSVSATLAVREEFASLSPAIGLDGNGSVTDVELRFSSGGGRTDVAGADWFVVTLRYSTGDTGTYFVPVPSQGGGNPGRGNGGGGNPGQGNGGGGNPRP